MALSLIMIFAVASMVGQIQGLQNHEFRLGTDATVSISFRLNEEHQYYCEIYSNDIGEPFCVNGTVDPDALRPEQRNRFKVNVTLSQKILTMELHISTIQERDEGVYVWAVKEHLESGDRVYTSDVYVGVIIPPGRTECRVLPSPYSSGLREVHCRASVASDGGGLLICYQNDVKTPFQSPPERSATDVTAVFWMDANYDIKCCSHEANYEKESKDCNDFFKTTYPTKIPRRPKAVTEDINTTNIATISDVITPYSKRHISTPRICTCTYALPTPNYHTTSSEKECKISKKSLHFIYGVIISILVILLGCTIHLYEETKSRVEKANSQIN